jgi:DNA-directed RNA polymerase subunit M/transcription elongation factor TFIIS
MEISNDYEKYIPIHPKRKHVFEKFKDLLLKYTDENNAFKKALNIERGIFNYAIDIYDSQNKDTWNELFYSNYISRVVTIYINLNPESYLKNTSLIKKFLNGDFNEFQLCKFTPDELYPDRAAELQHLYKTEIEVYGLDKNVEDGILKCGKCKSYKTTYYEMQTRSADEPTSKFCTCHNCGHKWRFC